MSSKKSHILIINAGSSSIKFAYYQCESHLEVLISGGIDRIGLQHSKLTVKTHSTNDLKTINVNVSDFNAAATQIIKELKNQVDLNNLAVIGHRLVHGMGHTQPAIIDQKLLTELSKISSYDPNHLPAEIELIKVFAKAFPKMLQVACFDTAFHTDIPKVAQTFAIPKKYYNEGVKRYGFHGISYSYLMQELKHKNKVEADGKIILAHLGNGASIAAVEKGKCMDTSMGFTPAGGIPMSTRSGDLDPGVAWFFMQKGMDAKKFNDLINHQSGLLGVSGLSSNMQDLLEKEKTNEDAALAINIFVYQIRKFIGAYVAILDGLQTLVFSGGIGENAPEIRSRICEYFGYLNLKLDNKRNAKNELIISAGDSAVKVYVIPTNEELMIAEQSRKIFLTETKKKQNKLTSEPLIK